MLAELVPAEALRKKLFHDSSLVSGGLLAIFGVPWPVEASLKSLPSSSQGILPGCEFLSKSSLFIGIIGAHFTSVWLHVNYLYMQQPYFQYDHILSCWV